MPPVKNSLENEILNIISELEPVKARIIAKQLGEIREMLTVFYMN